MNLELQESELPVHLRFGRSMEDDDLLRFCAKNEAWRVERESNGELIVITPAGGGTGHKNAYLVYALAAWAHAHHARGYYFDSNTGFNLADGSMRSPDAAWIEVSRWEALSKRDRERYPPLAPDFILELRSASDPQAVTIYPIGAEPQRLARPDVIRGTGPVDGFELALSKVWE